jgi:hypothetical protein
VLGEVVYPGDSLRRPFGRRKPKSGTIVPLPISETCAVSDLRALIYSGKKFGTIYADPPWPDQRKYLF